MLLEVGPDPLLQVLHRLRGVVGLYLLLHLLDGVEELGLVLLDEVLPVLLQLPQLLEGLQGFALLRHRGLLRVGTERLRIGNRAAERNFELQCKESLKASM